MGKGLKLKLSCCFIIPVYGIDFMSYTEELFSESLKHLLWPSWYNKLLRNYRPNWLKNPETGRNLEYDFYLPTNKVGFEIQGPLHFEDVYQKKKDDFKRILSTENNVQLIEVGALEISIINVRKLLKRSSRFNYKLRKVSIEIEKENTSKVKEYMLKIKCNYDKSDAMKQTCGLWFRDLYIAVENMIKDNDNSLLIRNFWENKKERLSIKIIGKNFKTKSHIGEDNNFKYEIPYLYPININIQKIIKYLPASYVGPLDLELQNFVRKFGVKLKRELKTY